MLRASGPAPSRARLRGIEGLRALAASSVVAYHCWLYSAPDGVRVHLGALTRFAIPNLRFGVTLFFTLSGFLLYRPIAAAVLRQAPLPSMRAYLRNRALRILPAYWVVLLIVGVLLPAALVRTPSVGLDLGRLAGHPELLAANAMFLQNYLPGSLLTGIGPAWSLSVEVVFYLVLPLLGALAAACARPAATGRGRTAATLLPVAVLLLIGVSGKLAASWLVLPGLGPSPGWDADWHSVLVRSFWGQADLFTFGMVLAVLQIELEDGRLRLPGWWWKAAVASWALLVPAAVVLAERHALDPYVYETLMALACGLLLALVVLPARAGLPLALIRGLEARPLVAIGLASYSLFLWHEPLVRWMRLHGLTAGGVGGFAFNLVTLGLLSGLLAALTYRCVERPALRRKAGRRPAPGGEPASVDAGARG